MTQELEIYYDPPDISCTTECKEDICEEISSYIKALKKELHKKLLKAEPESKEFYELQNMCLAIDQIKTSEILLDADDNDPEGSLLKGYEQIFDTIYSSPVENENSLVELKNIRTTKIPNMTLLNSKLSKFFFNIDEKAELRNGSDLPLKWKTGKKEKENDIYVHNVNFFQMVDGEQIPANIEFFDYIVFGGICSIIENLIKDSNKPGWIITVPMIYEIISGSPFKAKTGHTSSLSKKIIESINKMRTVFVEFDWRQQAEYMIEHHKFDKNDKNNKPPTPERCIAINSAMLSFTQVTAKINGHIHQAYKFLEVPHLYRYDRYIKQLVTLKKEILKIPNLSNTIGNVSLKIYLSRRVEWLKNPNNKISNKSFVLKTIFKECGFDFDNKLERSRKKDVILKILDYWKDIDYINNYQICKEGNKIYSVVVQV